METVKQLTDSQLIQLLQDDDETAIVEIYSRYAESLSNFAASKLYSLEDARDIIHDLFLKLWEDRKHLNITSNLKTYLFTITRYRIIDKIRRNITREEYAVMLQSLSNAYQPNVEQQIAAKELQQTIENCIDGLSPKVKEIYHLSREENLSIPEIAEKLGLSEQTVKNQLSTALSRIRKSLPGTYISILLLLWCS